jgi:hypothetical protein
MTIPKISLGCLTATMEKATQAEPDQFAVQTMTQLADDQPDLMMAVQHLVAMFMGEDKSDESDESESDSMVTADFAKEMICMSTFCVLGVAMKAIGATLEGAELEDQWSSNGDE